MRLFLLIAILYTCTAGYSEDLWVVEKHSFSKKPKPIDILFVIDNSPHLYKYQKKIAEQLPLFFESMQSLNWQAAVTTTDMSKTPHALNGYLKKLNSQGLRVVTKKTPNGIALLADGLLQEKASLCDPVCPSNNKEPLGASLTLIQNSSLNKDQFIRESAELVIIFLTDEDELSTGPWFATKPGQVLHAVKTLYPKKSLLSYGIFLQAGDRECKEQLTQQSTPSTHINYLIDINFGEKFSICRKQYGKILLEASQHIQRHLHPIYLHNLPEVDTIQLINNVPVHYSADEQKVIIHNPEAIQQTELVVRYKKTLDVIRPKEKN